MTYIDGISEALVRVLANACDGEPTRFERYAANAAFWADEVRHCLDVIAGYEWQFKAMRAAPSARRPANVMEAGTTARPTTGCGSTLVRPMRGCLTSAQVWLSGEAVLKAIKGLTEAAMRPAPAATGEAAG
jgi:hypothetical protein